MPIQMNVNGTVGKAIAKYAGKKVVELECAPDPVVQATYGWQAKFEDGEVVQFLTLNVAVQRITDLDLEEVEFSSWPPEEGRTPNSVFGFIHR